MSSLDLQDLLLLGLLPLLAFAFVYQAISNYFNHGLNRYPGPALAKFTKLWHRIDVKSNQHHIHLIELHRKYGDVVRIGPNALSIARPDYVSHIYGVKNELPKSDMYDAFSPRVSGKPTPNWLSVRNIKAHAAIHKPIGGAYSLSVLTTYEPIVDEIVRKFVDRLDEASKAGSGGCDMANWMRLCNNSFGFLDAGSDVNGFIAAQDTNIDIGALLVTIPWTAYLIKHNPILGLFQKYQYIFPSFCASQIQTRIDVRKTHRDNDFPASRTPPKDFLDRFLDAASTKTPPGYDFPLLMTWTLANIMAGGDTTAAALTTILYYVLKTPHSKSRLLEEVRSANIRRLVSWSDSQRLPYLDARIKEAFRIHPAIGMGLERTAKASGLLMPDGYTVPAGTDVSMNAWVINRQEIFGEDVDEFVPERWLQHTKTSETSDDYHERTTRMRRADLVFGAGSRACTGRYVSMLEIYKIIPTLLLEFDIIIDDAPWVTINRWFMRQTNMRCQVQRGAFSTIQDSHI